MGSTRATPDQGARFRLTLLGPFGLSGDDGNRVAVTSKRGQALLAILATSPRGERSRSWLEATLWCAKPAEQAKASLRKELSNLKKAVNGSGPALLQADTSRVWVDTDQLWTDVFHTTRSTGEEFLEGMDIPGEEAFEDWLREKRSELSGSSAVSSQPVVAEPNLDKPDEKPTRLAIAVLPIRMEPPKPELEFAAYGLGEELINRLSRLRWLPVIARSSSFALAPELTDPVAAGRALGARYIVEGSLRPSGSGFRLSIGLADADSGQTLWNEALVLKAIEDPHAIEATLDGLTAALDHRIDHSEQLRAIGTTDGNPDLLQLIWKARWHLVRLTDEDIAIAEGLLDQAAKLQPNSSEVLIERAWLTVRKLWLIRGSEEQIRALRKSAQTAIFADPSDARGHMIAGIAEFWLHQPLRAEGLLRRAVELNPSLVMAHAQLGSSLHHKGETEEAIETLETAIHLSPNDFDLFFTEGELAMAHLTEGNLEQSIAHAEASLSRRAAYWSSHVARINALVGLNRMTEAKAAHAEMLAAQPKFKPHFIDWLPYLDVSRNAALKDGLNQAATYTD